MISTAEELLAKTLRWWRMSLVYNGRTKGRLTISDGIDASMELRSQLNEERPLARRVDAFNRELVAHGNKPPRKRKKHTKNIHHLK